ncbi:hypothetical protein AB0903_33595 [Streptomyces sp. NPDC048389]|uniref:hypothetical protein n=1 Tax=Streptomyces sp. NPDC048389 TaxID=3154622 RepID=UPI00345301BB
MSAVDEQAEAHRLKSELGYGARRIGKELGISRYAAERLLARPLPQPVAEPVGQVVAEVAEPVAEVADRPAEVAEPVAEVADRPGRLVLELYPGLADDLATLQRTGCTAEAAVDYAVAVLAGAYRNAVQLGVLSDGDVLDVLAVTFRPPARTATAA